MRRRGSTGGPSSDLVHARGQLAQGPHLERVVAGGRGNPRHQCRGARAPRPWPPARAGSPATCPGGRGRQPRETQGTGGGIGCRTLRGPRTPLRHGSEPRRSSIQADRAWTRVHTCSPVLLLIVARVLWTARPPARPALGAEATIAEPAGPMTFRCPLAVRSTCPPARCTAATISLASLDRQRFGAAGFFSAIPDDLSIPRTCPDLIVDSAPSPRKSQATRFLQLGFRKLCPLFP